MAGARASAIILAAGRSSRMGEPKLALPFRGSTVLARVLWAMGRAGVSERILVLGHHRERLEPIAREAAAGGGPPVVLLQNPDPEADMASSVRIGVRGASAASDWFLITPADLPALEPESVDRLLEEAGRCGGLKRPPLLVPIHQGRSGHPLALPEALRADILGSPPGWKLSDWVHGVAYPVREVRVDGDGIWRDIDAPGDLEELE
jgi:molybdenum cofactor cytidylyltransferase